MNTKKLSILIATILVVFVLIKIVATKLCGPDRDRVVAQVVSTFAVDLGSVNSSKQASVDPNPLSWQPLLNQLAAFS